jgi:putative membrane protein insertion efficiency factor
MARNRWHNRSAYATRVLIRRLVDSVNAGATALLLALIRLYQLVLSPWIGRQCRFYPTCSHYARDAVALCGPWRGSWLALKRLGRCHPFAEGGYDPVRHDPLAAHHAPHSR